MTKLISCPVNVQMGGKFAEAWRTDGKQKEGKNIKLMQTGFCVFLFAKKFAENVKIDTY